MESAQSSQKLEVHVRTLERERKARQRAEFLLEQTSRDFYRANQALKEFLETLTGMFFQKSFDVREVLEAFVIAVCRMSRWPVGHAFILAEGRDDELVSAHIWHDETGSDLAQFKKVSEMMRFKAGVGLPGRVLASGKVCWIDDIHVDPNFPRVAIFDSIDGVHSAFAVPIKCNGKIVAVAEFFSEKLLKEVSWITALAESVSLQIGIFLDRKLFEEQRQIHLELLENANQELKSTHEKMIQTAKMSALGEMAGGIAHEINNPLAILKGVGEQIQNQARRSPVDGERILRSVQKLDRTVDRIARIVKGLRSFSRDGSEDPFKIVNVNDLLEQTLAICSEAFKNQAVEVNIEAFDQSLDFVGREIPISQVLLNLLINAKDAVENESEKWIKVSVSGCAECVEIRVQDSGKGIPKVIQEKMFQPFFTTKGIGKGTGLGLSISLGIVQAHRGELFYEPGTQGACFVIRLPRRQIQKGRSS